MLSLPGIESDPSLRVNLWLYLRLVVLTVGTLLPLFWMVVILGHRRQRNFERIFFFLCLSLFLFFGSALLGLNGRLYYGAAPAGLSRFCWVLLCVGFWLFPSLLLHLHAEYAEIRGLLTRSAKRFWATAAYAPALLLVARLVAALGIADNFEWNVPSRALGAIFQIWLVLALAGAAAWQLRFFGTAPDEEQRGFHRTLAVDLLVLTILVGALHLARTTQAVQIISGVLGILALIPLVTLIRNVQRFNFLQIGRQRNLIYAVFLAFVALLYLSFVRRVSTWTGAYLPPEATAAILLFLPVLFFEPLQRFMRRLLRAAAQREVGRVQELMAEIQQESRQGNVNALAGFVERRLKQTFELAAVSVRFWKERGTSDATQRFATRAGLGTAQPAKPTIAFSEGKIAGAHAIGESNFVGSVRAEAHGAALSGETCAALELLCEQLPAALSLCWLIEEKLRLERELAERERLALLGQMAATISHNLKNPLGSMKTILQLQLENPQMPESLRAETKMVLDEVSRLSAKLSQLLQFSRPAVRGGGAPAHCDAWSVAEQVVSVLRPEAERRGVHLQLAGRNGLAARCVGLSGEALSDILSNLIVNAIDASGRDGRVQIGATCANGNFTFAVEDGGAGVPDSDRDKILQPFFTTKSQGTGLGLAIVARRVAEAGGELRWESPVRDGRGARFAVTLKTMPWEKRLNPEGADTRTESTEQEKGSGE